MAMVGTIAYVPLFVQGVIGSSATSSGVVLTPFFIGAVITSAISGQWISRSGHYRPNALAGPVILGAGLFLLSRMDASTTSFEAARNMVIAGVGLGLMMQVFVIAVQNVVPHPADGLGDGADAVRPRDRRDARRDADGRDRQPAASGGRTRAPPERPPAAPDLRDGLAHALQPAFLAAALLCVVTLAVVYFWLDEVPLQKELEMPDGHAGGRPARGRDPGSSPEGLRSNA